MFFKKLAQRFNQVRLDKVAKLLALIRVRLNEYLRHVEDNQPYIVLVAAAKHFLTHNLHAILK
jgi:hypothetical protein